MCLSLITSALSAAFGASCGALAAYRLMCRKEDERRKDEYLALLLLVYEHLESLYTTFSDAAELSVKEVDSAKVVVFDLPLPELPLSPEQMQSLMQLAPDKQMPSTLIKVQHFLNTHARRVKSSGANFLTLEFVENQVEQLRFMLLSVRTQYEQASNAAFPLDELAHT